MNFVGQDAMKGSRKSWKYWIVSDMLQTLQHDAKINWRQFQNTFFKLGPIGEFEACQKKIFKAKNPMEVSKQLQKFVYRIEEEAFYFIL